MSYAMTRHVSTRSRVFVGSFDFATPLSWFECAESICFGGRTPKQAAAVAAGCISCGSDTSAGGEVARHLPGR